MTYSNLQEFFFWSMIINICVYLITSISIVAFRAFVVKVHKWAFNMEEKSVVVAMYKYLANYKLLITFFNFTPWLVLLILQA